MWSSQRSAWVLFPPGYGDLGPLVCTPYRRVSKDKYIFNALMGPPLGNKNGVFIVEIIRGIFQTSSQKLKSPEENPGHA
jgi:hypothetical protein